MLRTSRPYSAITTVVEIAGETETTLVVGTEEDPVDHDDYITAVGSTLLHRNPYGSTHGAIAWAPRVRVTYTAADDEAERIGVLVLLCKLELNYQPGLQGEGAGPFNQQQANNSVWNYKLEREAILSTLDPPEPLFW